MAEGQRRSERTPVPLISKILEEFNLAQNELDLAIQTPPDLTDLYSIGNLWSKIANCYKNVETICRDLEKRLFADGRAAESHAYRIRRYEFKTDVGRSCAYFKSLYEDQGIDFPFSEISMNMSMVATEEAKSSSHTGNISAAAADNTDALALLQTTNPSLPDEPMTPNVPPSVSAAPQDVPSLSPIVPTVRSVPPSGPSLPLTSTPKPPAVGNVQGAARGIQSPTQVPARKGVTFTTNPFLTSPPATEEYAEFAAGLGGADHSSHESLAPSHPGAPAQLTPPCQEHRCGSYHETKRAETELLRGPRGASKFGGTKDDNYHFWAENFLYNLSLAGNITGYKKLLALQANTTGTAKSIVDGYAKFARDATADIFFDRAWTSLKDRFGIDSVRADTLDDQIKRFKPLEMPLSLDSVSLLRDMCFYVQSSLSSPDNRDKVLYKYNEKSGLDILAQKLPEFHLERWKDRVIELKKASSADPTLDHFLDFVSDLHLRLTDPFLRTLPQSSTPSSRSTKSVKGFRTEASVNPSSPDASTAAKPIKGLPWCTIHKVTTHNLRDCFKFQSLSFAEKKKIMGYKLCRNCAGHLYTNSCFQKLTCKDCGGGHATSLHAFHLAQTAAPAHTLPSSPSSPSSTPSAGAAAAGVVPSHTSFSGRSVGRSDTVSFSKTLPVFIRHKDHPHKTLQGLVMVDEHADQCFVDKSVPDDLAISAPQCEYNLETLAGLNLRLHGKSVSGLQIKGLRGQRWYDVPTALTGGHIPDSRAERATRQVVESIPTLKHLASHFEDEDESLQTLLVMGRSMTNAFNIKCFGSQPPYAHQNLLGWAVVGEFPRASLPPHTLAARTTKPAVPRAYRSVVSDVIASANLRFLDRHEELRPSSDVFEVRQDDDELTWSHNDEQFLQTLKDGTERLPDGRLQLPLPLKVPTQPIPNNEVPVFCRNRSTLQRACKDGWTVKKIREAMQQYFDLGHVERVPNTVPRTDLQNLWWLLPLVFVVQAKKDNIRITLDGSATYKNCSLNKLLHSGPDLNNSLRGVLHRFRLHKVAFSFDLRHMYNCFVVPEWQRNLLCFHWWDDNKPQNPITLYRFTVHLFGANSSPGVAMFAMKVIAAMGRASGELTEDEARFIENCFYMDDGCSSLPTTEEVITLLKAVIYFLKTFHLKAHKINSNSKVVLDAFGDLASTEPSLSFASIDPNPIPRALGVTWDTCADTLSVPLQLPERAFTRRGVLATVNTTFDPLGIASPLILGGRILQRKILEANPIISKDDWDQLLPNELAEEWRVWRDNFSKGESIQIPRCIIPFSYKKVEVHAFADASEAAIGYVIYLKTIAVDGTVNVSFLCANSKIAPKGSTSMPRLELCAALQVALMCHALLKELKIECDTFLYTDSMVVLGYLRNCDKRFTKFVTRRIEAITQLFDSSKWHYVNTSSNPADIATRPTTPDELKDSCWLTGPSFLFLPLEPSLPDSPVPDTLPETLPVVKVACASATPERSLWHVAAERTSRWSKLVRLVQCVLGGARAWLHRARQRLMIHSVPKNTVISFKEAEKVLFLSSQKEAFPEIFLSNDSINEPKLTILP